MQQYWTDKDEELSWIEPDGSIKKKKPKNRKIGLKRHGHTIFQGRPWESNFEKEFDIDNDVHEIVAAIRELKPLESNPSGLATTLELCKRKDRSLREICKLYQIEERIHRNLLLLLLSLLIRNPNNRARSEDYSTLLGLQPNEQVGKKNMEQSYLIAKNLSLTEHISNHFFVLLHSPAKKFIYGDGAFDALTPNLIGLTIRGSALLPLTPDICVYFCTTVMMPATPNCASLLASPWMVDQINEITQVYSKDKLFFLGKPPKLTEDFHRREFLAFVEGSVGLLDMLEEVAEPQKYRDPIFQIFSEP